MESTHRQCNMEWLKPAAGMPAECICKQCFCAVATVCDHKKRFFGYFSFCLAHLWFIVRPSCLRDVRDWRCTMENRTSRLQMNEKAKKDGAKTKKKNCKTNKNEWKGTIRVLRSFRRVAEGEKICWSPFGIFVHFLSSFHNRIWKMECQN